MEPDLAPEEIRGAQFRTVLRGLDTAEVTAYLDRLAGVVEALVEQRDRLSARLGEYADRDLKSEFEDVGREVASVLQSAREAAESMRERASLDAAKWRAEATSEAETLLKEARNDAEALRGDAWATGTELLSQTQVLIRQLRQDAERDVLTVMGEAERDAHRLTSSARREAEEILRSASMDAEKTTAQATKRHDEMIEQAHRAAESAQERTRALEERREELLEELEHARSTLNRLEGTLEERREGLNVIAEPSSSVRIVTPTSRHEPEAPPTRGTWQPGETVRIIQSGQRDMADPEPLADELAADVERIKQRDVEPEPLAETVPAAEPVPAVDREPDTEPMAEESTEPEPRAGAGAGADSARAATHTEGLRRSRCPVCRIAWRGERNRSRRTSRSWPGGARPRPRSGTSSGAPLAGPGRNRRGGFRMDGGARDPAASHHQSGPAWSEEVGHRGAEHRARQSANRRGLEA